MTAPHLEIRRNGPDGFAVALTSPNVDLHAMFPPLPYPDHDRALYAAQSAASAAGWRVVDRTGPIGEGA